jgi:hypothetical protein
LCTDGLVQEIFLSGTEPRELCDLHAREAEIDAFLMRKLREKYRLLGWDSSDSFFDFDLPESSEFFEQPDAGPTDGAL